jgi:hypothetical protein
MDPEMFHFLGGEIYGEEYQRLKATLCVDPRTAKIYLVREQSYDSIEMADGSYEWQDAPDCFEFVEVVNFDRDPDLPPMPDDSPPSWWCRLFAMPADLVPAKTKYRRPPICPTLPPE